jgi:hypothetical protein
MVLHAPSVWERRSLPALNKGQSEKSDWPFPFVSTSPVTFGIGSVGHAPDMHVIAMSLENPSDGLPAYTRFWLLVLGEAIAGVVLYALFPFMPAAVQVLVFLTATAIAVVGRPKRNEEKSLASLVSAYTGVFVRICVICVIVLERSRLMITREDVEWRVVFVGVCLVAALRLLDRRVGFRE